MQKNLLQPLLDSASPFCFSAPFSSSLFFLGQRIVSPFIFLALPFLFLLMCCPFSTQVLSPKRFSVQANTFFFFSFLFCFQLTFFISVQRLLLLLLFSFPFTCLQLLTSSFLQTCCSFKFSLLFFQPKTILSPKYFFSFSVQTFLLQFSHSSLLFFYFILFWFSPLFSLSAPPFFLFFSSVYPRPNILSSCFTSLLFD